MRCSVCAVGRAIGVPAVSCAARTPPRAGLFLQIANLIGVGLLVSACASSHASYDGYSNVGGPWPAQVAMSAPQPIELEDDGLAVQAPPQARKNTEPDDPSEPFSPNYGPAPAGVPDEVEPASTRAAALRAAERQLLQYRSRTTPQRPPMSPAEVEAILVQAMIAHERRNP